MECHEEGERDEQEVDVVYCVKCGKEVDDTANFCSSCGQEVGAGVKKRKEFKISVPRIVVVRESNESSLDGGREHLFSTMSNRIGMSLDTFISLVIMVVAILLCFSPWFRLMEMGSYSPLEWKSFIDSSTYYLGEAIYKGATLIPGSVIWMNMPLVWYVINLIMILYKKENLVGLEIMGLLFSLAIYVFMKFFFAAYDRYLTMGHSTYSSFHIGYYIMVILVTVDVVRTLVCRRKKSDVNGGL